MIGANVPLMLYRQQLSTERDDLGRRNASFVLVDAFVGNLHEDASRVLTQGGTVATVGQWTALVPPGVRVTNRDVIEDAAGRRFRIDSYAARVGPSGAVRHTMCRCTLVEAS